jgi:vitamin K epoxide reductase family protein
MGQTLRTKRAASCDQPDPRDRVHWKKRVQVAVLAVVGFSIAGYLAAYQAGLFRQVWEPFFGNGSNRVLHSFVAAMLPVPDAALGAIGYAIEFVASLIGTAERWRSRPKLVLVYGLIVAGMGMAGLALLALQAFVLHAFCTLCLVSAIISIVIVFLARGEVVASFKSFYQPL